MRAFPPAVFADRSADKSRLCTECNERLTSTGICETCARELEVKGEELPPTPTDVPELPLPEPLPRCKTFAQALIRERKLENFTRLDVGQVVGVSVGAVASWENEKAVPIRVHYERLCDLFPRLLENPEPDWRDMVKPPGRPPPMNGEALTMRFGDIYPAGIAPRPAVLEAVEDSPPEAEEPPPPERREPDPIERAVDLLDAINPSFPHEITIRRHSSGWTVSAMGALVSGTGPSTSEAFAQLMAKLQDDLRGKAAALREQAERLERLMRGKA